MSLRILVSREFHPTFSPSIIEATHCIGLPAAPTPLICNAPLYVSAVSEIVHPAAPGELPMLMIVGAKTTVEDAPAPRVAIPNTLQALLSALAVSRAITNHCTT